MIIKQKASRAPVAGGSYLAVCVYSIDLGEQLHKYADSSNYHNDVLLGWELCGFTYAEDGEQKPYDVTATYTASMDERSKLRKTIEGWNGRKMTDAELEGFQTNDLVGRTAMLGIVINEKGYNNINSVQPIPEYMIQQGMPMPQATIPYITFDLEPWDQQAFEALPEWARKRVMKSTEYQKLYVQPQEVQIQPPMNLQMPPQMQAPAKPIQAPTAQPSMVSRQTPAGQTMPQTQAESEFFAAPAQGVAPF